MINQLRFASVCTAVVLLLSLTACSTGNGSAADKNKGVASGRSSQASQVSQAAGSSETGGAAAMKDYSDSTYGFSFSYPAGWELKEGTGDTVCTVSAPAAQVTDGYTQNLSVAVRQTGSKTLDGVDENEVSRFSSTMRGYTQLTNDNITLSHTKGYKIDFTCTQNGKTIRQANYFIVTGGREYMVTCSALSDDYYNDALQFTDLLKTFTVK